MAALRFLLCTFVVVAIFHSIIAQEDVADDHENRLFFTGFPSLTSCNYTAQAGASCPSCTQALRCLPNNLGIVTTCRGLFRHCNNGRCSLFQSSACSNSTSG